MRRGGGIGVRRGWAAGVLGITLMAACSSPGTAPREGRLPAWAVQHLVKSDVNRFVEADQQRIFISLRRLAVKLYKRNPKEWRKSAPTLEAAVSRIFDDKHGWRFEELGYRRGVDAIQVALHPGYRGDRVMAYIVGMAGMVQLAFGDREEFYVLDDLDAQHLYNAARNVEIAAWKLASARDERGELLLLSNEIGDISNLSFEREFGRIIGLLELLSDVIEEKTERTVTRVVQSMATAVFLPVH
ncbi:hypothetical protein [Azoarcus sp. TTM-91]|uniref:hypothetical protein n=1 Tax=Azoarcus sp. TTM-91 TaxID=2691581 RepID=UPI002006EBCC|nr:hypothetical protein [Azoarcus sp. TTM-91]